MDAPIIDAVAETFGNINGFDGGTTTETIYDSDTLNGDPIDPADVTTTVNTIDAPLTLNPDGTISVAPGTPAGDYTLNYTICENNNPTNCDTVTETVKVDAPIIDAVAETFAPINGFEGGTTPTILTSDTINGVQATTTNVALTVDAILNPDGMPTTAISVGADGTVTVPAETSCR